MALAVLQAIKKSCGNVIHLTIITICLTPLVATTDPNMVSIDRDGSLHEDGCQNLHDLVAINNANKVKRMQV